jgi:PAS domain S-box-containing protein
MTSPFSHSDLSDQERAVLRLACNGLTDKEIARNLELSEKTIDTYWTRMRQKLNAKNRTHVVAKVLGAALDAADQENCESLHDACEEGVWIVRFDGQTTYANQAVADMFGLSLEEMQSAQAGDLMDEEAKEQGRKMLEEQPDGRYSTFQFRFRRPDGTDLWVMMTSSPLTDISEQPVKLLLMLNEIPPPEEER